MITQVDLVKREERALFVQQAAEAFAVNKKFYTYTSGEITKGCLFAVRWGLSDDCIVVFRLDEEAEIENYANVSKKRPIT